ncbi:PAQR family membrane homeostasis protein TrhA [Solitalea lacus]|uniref:PAQR family membrane homeostasis protein TrhA n=1 Tax=Solitalea lacus TaxID=2911172 RepID=UPI001EDA4266|nr:hemolysin III family protein [Solitalea lacus]UKJ08843.1 hemolysin III family protein [Solitalea lacus]
MNLFTYPSYEERHERLNTLTHVYGAIFFAIGGIYLLWECKFLKAHLFMPISFYVMALITMFIVSSIYHATRQPERKRIWQIVDHCCIFLLIGGTYVPVIMRYIKNDTGSVFLTSMWTIIITGIFLKIFFTGKYTLLSTIVYVCLGWMGLFIIQPLIETVPNPTLSLFGLGGVLYTIGVYFYRNEKITYNHTIWHFFVLGGAAAHYGAMLQLISY